MTNYTFQSFIVSEASRAAFAAAVSIAQRRDAGALFLCGPTGSGKTHLLHAIASGIRHRRPDARVLHLAANDLASRFNQAIRTNSVPAFRQSLKAVDVLIVDDLYLPPHTLEEILRIAEALTAEGRIVASAATTSPPRWPGPVVEIGSPDEVTAAQVARFRNRHSLRL